MRPRLHLCLGQTTVLIMSVTALAGVVFATGGVVVLGMVQGANQLTFGQMMILGGLLGGLPTTVTLWVIRVLYDVRSEVAKLHDIPQRVKALEDKANA